jgi:hypothetical protein
MLESLVDIVLRWWYRAPTCTGPKIKVIYAFNQGPEHLGGYHRTLPRDAPLTGALARLYIPKEWGDDYRLEIRYELKNKKYRRIVRGPLTDVKLDGDGSPEPRILLARLIPREDTDAIAVDVTPRVAKYAGPDRAFPDVRLADMFPFDDNEDNATRFKCLRIMDAKFRVWDVPFDLENNPLVTR